MRDTLLRWLVDPADGRSLTLESPSIDPARPGDIAAGRLKSESGRAYPIDNGIPRFVRRDDAGQRQVEESFGYKWAQQHSYQSEGMLNQGRAWLVSRYGFQTAEDFAAHMSSARGVLDVGCGGGYSASLWMPNGWRGVMWIGADISDAIEVARARLSHLPATEFVQADVMQLPFAEGAFDIVFSEGVLHHTPSTEAAFAAAARLVRPGGEIMAYVYRKKAPVREFTDDHVRASLSKMAPGDAWEALRPLTHLGRALSELDAEINLPEAIPVLGIPAGRHNVQRLVYWHFAKTFWNDALTFEENHHINFDWYHPAYAHRHTEEEVRGWCDALGLSVTRLDVQESGITVRAARH